LNKVDKCIENQNILFAILLIKSKWEINNSS